MSYANQCLHVKEYTRGLTCDGSSSETLLFVLLLMATGGNHCLRRRRCFAVENRPHILLNRLEPVFCSGLGGFAVRKSFDRMAAFPNTLPRCHGTSSLINVETV